VDSDGVHLVKDGTYYLKQDRMQLTVSYTDVHPACELKLTQSIDPGWTTLQTEPKPTTADADGLYSLTMNVDRFVLFYL